MAAISAFGVTQHSQIFSLFFRNRIQCIALYQLHNSQALLNLRRGYYTYLEIFHCTHHPVIPESDLYLLSVLPQMHCLKEHHSNY